MFDDFVGRERRLHRLPGGQRQLGVDDPLSRRHRPDGLGELTGRCVLQQETADVGGERPADRARPICLNVWRRCL